MSILLDLIYIVALGALKILGRFRPRFAGALAGRMSRKDVMHEASPAGAGAILVHAVSVGEVNLLRAFIADLEAMFPEYEVIISASTTTGRNVAEKHFPTRRIVPWPLDLSYHVRPFLETLRVKIVLLLELEVWPNFVMQAAKKKIPVVVVNGRLTAESFRRYRLFRFFFRRVFRRLKLVFVQNEDYAGRFIRLGAPRERIFLAGTMKYDLVPTGNEPAREAEVRRKLHLDEAEPVLLGGSTHPGEEAIVLDTWIALKNDFPDLRLVLAPRHINRIDEIKDLVWDAGENFYLKSEFDRKPGGEFPDRRVIIVDTVGDLAEIYRVAAVAFVGGSIVQYGGHNMLEPAALGVPVVVGPNTDNFADVLELLHRADAIAVVRDKRELGEACRMILGNPRMRKKVGQRAIRAIEGAKGATRRHLGALAKLTGAAVPDRLAERDDARPVPAAAASP